MRKPDLRITFCLTLFSAVVQADPLIAVLAQWLLARVR